MRALSANFRAAMMAEDTGEIPVFLLTVSHADLPEDLRLSSDNGDLLDFERQERGTVSRGHAYRFLPMGLSLPDEGDDASATIQITLYDVAHEVTPILKASIRPALVTIELVLASAPDDIEAEYPFFEVTTADIGAGDVVLTLNVDALGQEPFPADNFNPSSFGGLWANT